ncbi:MAG: M3 family peptidase, partial [Alistipes sp.]|nr:M3 family peptidase [Alistipes sp.]
MITTTLIMSAMTAMAATSAQPLVEMPESLKGNPLVEEWNTPYQTPPFSEIELAHYEPAIDYAIELNRAEIEAIINNPEAPTFENTIVAMNNSGELLGRISGVFFVLNNCVTSPEMQQIA